MSSSPIDLALERIKLARELLRVELANLRAAEAVKTPAGDSPAGGGGLVAPVPGDPNAYLGRALEPYRGRAKTETRLTFQTVSSTPQRLIGSNGARRLLVVSCQPTTSAVIGPSADINTSGRGLTVGSQVSLVILDLATWGEWVKREWWFVSSSFSGHISVFEEFYV